jgi:hypothetical protein
MFGAAILAAAAAFGTKLLLGTLHPVPAAAVVSGVFGAVYLSAAWGLRVSEARVFAESLLARLRR